MLQLRGNTAGVGVLQGQEHEGRHEKRLQKVLEQEAVAVSEGSCRKEKKHNRHSEGLNALQVLRRCRSTLPAGQLKKRKLSLNRQAFLFILIIFAEFNNKVRTKL